MKNILKKALNFAIVAHRGQLYSGKDFIVHPIMTANTLELWAPNDKNLIAAGYLHDVLENTETTLETLQDKFGEDIANLVFEVTKTGYNKFPNLKSRRAVLLKYADRGANLANIEIWDEEKQQVYIKKSKFWEV
jgi:(p)ppGpp synthase/HD superfamily hydrolase